MRGCLGIGMCGVPIEHEVHAVDERRAVMLEELEQLDAALVLVDAADVDREAIAHVELLAEAPAVRSFRNLRADADDHAGHRLVVRHALNQRALFEGVVHERAHAAEDRRIDAEPERAVAFRGRHQDRLRRHRAAAVIRVVVAEAEEDEEVVVGFVRLDVLDQRRARRPFRFEPRQLVTRANAAAVNTFSDHFANSIGLRSTETGKRCTGTP